MSMHEAVTYQRPVYACTWCIKDLIAVSFFDRFSAHVQGIEHQHVMRTEQNGPICTSVLATRLTRFQPLETCKTPYLRKCY